MIASSTSKTEMKRNWRTSENIIVRDGYSRDSSRHYGISSGTVMDAATTAFHWLLR